MKFSYITCATLLIVISLFFGAAEYFLYDDQQELKMLCMNLANKIQDLEQQNIALLQGGQVSHASSTVIATTTSAQLWASLQKKVQNTVVQLFVQSTNFNWLEPYKVPQENIGFGSGFFINEEGEIITNAHVVNQASIMHIKIPSFGKHQFEVDLVGIMPEKDLALVKIRPEGLALIRSMLGKVPYLPLGDSDLIFRGDEVMALGYPLGQ